MYNLLINIYSVAYHSLVMFSGWLGNAYAPPSLSIGVLHVACRQKLLKVTDGTETGRSVVNLTEINGVGYRCPVIQDAYVVRGLRSRGALYEFEDYAAGVRRPSAVADAQRR